MQGVYTMSSEQQKEDSLGLFRVLWWANKLCIYFGKMSCQKTVGIHVLVGLSCTI